MLYSNNETWGPSVARFNFDKLTVAELKEAQTEIASLIETKAVEERAAVKAKMLELASASGFSLEDLFNGKMNGAKKASKVQPKYRNPDAPDQLWSGRGRQPLWFAAAIKKGIKQDKLLIK